MNPAARPSVAPPVGRSGAVRLAVAVCATLAVIGAASLLGRPIISPLDAVRALAAPHTTESTTAAAPDPAMFYVQYRVPRTALAALAGAGLAVSGVLLQTLFRNPLASPFTLGVASGASLGAAAGILAGVNGIVWLIPGVLRVPSLNLLALLGALAAMGALAGLARLRASRDMTRLLLAGVCITYICSAGIVLITYLAEAGVTNSIVKWLMGSLATYRPQAPWEVAIVLLPLLLVGLYTHRALELLLVDEQLAATRGVAVGRVVWSCFAVVGLAVAVIVANCGPIGFIGLMAPHLARAIVGVRAAPGIVASALIGAAFLALCDGVARSLSDYEIPVGVLTNTLGAGFFLYLLATRDRLGFVAR